MGFEQDKLNRKRYANFLTEIISNTEKYKRISDSESMSLAIDSSWGTGKTTFINMWKEDLEELKDENGYNKFTIINYNAWKNDFIDEPFESLIYTIINHDVFNKQNEIDGGIEAGKDLLKYGSKLAIGLVKFAVRLAIGNEAGDVTGELIETVLTNGVGGIRDIFNASVSNDPKYENFYTEYKNYYETIEKLKETLSKISLQRPIIIIIDELDRCKPLFAIKLLENIKHIFDVKNVTFVFALDMEQLSHSIKCIYGQEMNANGYLCRFFDYISKMPVPNIDCYIKNLVKEKKLIRDNFVEQSYGEVDKNFSFADVFSLFAQKMKLSLRDINTIYSNFMILESIKLKNIDNIYIYVFYLFLIILKYKKIDVFNSIFVYKNYNPVNKKDMDYILVDFEEYLDYNFWKEIFSNTKISNIVYSVKDCKEKYNIKINDIRENKFIYFDFNHFPKEEAFSNNVVLSKSLFYDDLIHWNEIKDKGIADYIQENLEVFNFEYENES